MYCPSLSVQHWTVHVYVRATDYTVCYTAGADIKEMQPREFSDVYTGNFLGFWNSLALFDKPVIAAVNGFAVSTV